MFQKRESANGYDLPVHDTVKCLLFVQEVPSNFDSKLTLLNGQDLLDIQYKCVGFHKHFGDNVKSVKTIKQTIVKQILSVQEVLAHFIW